MVTSGTAERVQFSLPLGAALAAVVTAVAGTWRIAFTGPPDGLFMMLYIAPPLAVIAVASLVAAVQRRWSPRWIVVTVLALVATLSLSSAVWMFSLPDEEQLPLLLFWTTGIAYLILAGVTTSIALAPRLSRQFTSPGSLVLGFVCGIVGAPLILFVMGPGIGIVLIGITVIVLTLRLRGRIGGRPTRRLQG